MYVSMLMMCLYDIGTSVWPTNVVVLQYVHEAMLSLVRMHVYIFTLMYMYIYIYIYICIYKCLCEMHVSMLICVSMI